MRGNLLDSLSGLDSPVHRLPAWLKLLSAVGIVILTVLAPPEWWFLYAVEAAGVPAVAALARIPQRFLLRRVALLEPFVIGVALLALFQPAGLRVFAFLMIRSTLCLAVMVLLANTTPFSQLLGVMQRLRVPALLITTLALMYRYLFVLVDETHRMRMARRSRTFTHTRTWSWRSGSGIISQLFIRATERAERIYSAMCARGWQ